MRPGGAESLVGTVIGERYKLERVIGEGGMSAVYAAEHVHMHKKLAVKILTAEMSDVPEAVARFKREAQAASRIEHPNIVAATDFGELPDGSFFLVLELVEGPALRDAIAAGPLPAARALHIARQIADALARAHSLGIVHRDLKPENVMLAEKDGAADVVKILDFGMAKMAPKDLSRSVAAPLTQVGLVYGTPAYMPPEQAMGAAVDARADLYALGVILFEMLAGHRPWDDEDKTALLRKHISEPVPPVPNAPPQLEAMVHKLMAKQAGDRYATADEVVAAIDALPPADAPEASFVPPLKTLPLAAAAAPAPAAQPPPPAPGAQPPPPGWFERARSRIARAAAPVLDRLDRALPLDRVPLKIPRRQKLWVVLGAAALWLLFAGGLVIGLAVHFASRDETHPSARTPAAVDHRARCLAAASTGDAARVVREANALVAASPGANFDDVAKAVAGAAAAEPDAAFDLLEHKLGRAGADQLYELAWGPLASSTPDVAARAKRALESDAIEPHLDPALAVTIHIRATSNICEAKTRYFATAAKVGDARTLAALEPYKKRWGCGRRGRHDCHPCLRTGSDSIEKTVAAIRARTATDGSRAE
jgi:tRNA A-37 threonylcarbamoyl transferase component Bud32